MDSLACMRLGNQCPAVNEPNLSHFPGSQWQALELCLGRSQLGCMVPWASFNILALGILHHTWSISPYSPGGLPGCLLHDLTSLHMLTPGVGMSCCLCSPAVPTHLSPPLDSPGYWLLSPLVAYPVMIHLPAPREPCAHSLDLLFIVIFFQSHPGRRTRAKLDPRT